ncbi:primosomal protein N' [Candidatus Profftia tarda]|uniref:Replication restart protein PriA n=1 Tax=Candidatus Profftia tarda TaxID=1177216 RepID=A0A8E4F073_9ENTR|nr:primosomal protein N' [Candidatus Profftia tarda]CAD6510944.1 Primosomal protein N' [Candidatus Profftia tarda]
MKVVTVALPVPLTKIFEYLIPSSVTAIIGARVLVPFGRNKMIGIITGSLESSKLPHKHLKYIDQILDNVSLFSSYTWYMLHWAADYYHYPLGKVLLHSLPVMLRQGNTAQRNERRQWRVTAAGSSLPLKLLERAPKQQQALAILVNNPLYRDQLIEYNITETTLKKIKAKGLVELCTKSSKTDNWQHNYVENSKCLTLSKEQAVAVKEIKNQDKKFIVWLLEGVPSSGKTEVYLNVIEHILKEGRQALVLLPEINLTMESITRCRKRLNAPIDALHSHLSINERLSSWLRARNGESAVVIGTRSAIFTPFARLGIIIIDQEHDSSYKEKKGLRYHARDLAILRAHKEGIPILLSSATPSLETIHNVTLGKYRQLRLTKRRVSSKSIMKHIVDLNRIPLKAGISETLLTRMKQHINVGNQVILLLNRRGFAPILMCHKCGWIIVCKKCDHYYTLHHEKDHLDCHLCNTKILIPQQCSKCESPNMLTVGRGTEQLEAELNLLFPKTKIMRIDRDTIRKKSLDKQLADIDCRSASILIGTQMLAKRQKNINNNVTLVALLDFDSAMFSIDFHAFERFAQLYTQVTAQVEHPEKHGEVILQTHHPEHPLTLTLINKGYDAFARQVLEKRKDTSLPPYTNHILMRAKDYDNKNAVKFLQKSRNLLENSPLRDKSFWIFGPIPSLQPKRGGCFCWQLLIEHPSRAYLQKIVKGIMPLIRSLPIIKKVEWTIDVDPIDY